MNEKCEICQNHLFWNDHFESFETIYKFRLIDVNRLKLAFALSSNSSPYKILEKKNILKQTPLTLNDNLGDSIGFTRRIHGPAPVPALVGLLDPVEADVVVLDANGGGHGAVDRQPLDGDGLVAGGATVDEGVVAGADNLARGREGYLRWT